MKDFRIMLFFCLCLTLLVGCQSRTIYEEIENNINEIEEQYGFPTACFAYYEERWGYHKSDGIWKKNKERTGWELEVMWISESPSDDRFLLIDKNERGVFVEVEMSNVVKLREFADKNAALYAVELQEYMLKPDIKRSDLPVKIGVIKSSDPKGFNFIVIGNN